MSTQPSRLHGPLQRILGDRGHAGLLRAWRCLQYERDRAGPAARRWWRHGRTAPRVVFHPQQPSRYHVILRCCARAGYRLSARSARRAAAVVAFSTETRWEPDDVLRRLAEHRRVLNLGCTDISKTHVNTVFAATFGRDLGLDPTRHIGPAVCKSDENAVHDGEIVDCPIRAPAPGAAYQRLIDNRTGDGRVVDIRVAIVDGTIPVTYHRYRPEDRRFRSGNERAELVESTEVLTAGETRQLLAFARAMGLDLGEMDVLRDRHDGQIYVVDVNPTPWGPPSGLVPTDAEPALRHLTAALRRVVECRPGTRSGA